MNLYFPWDRNKGRGDCDIQGDEGVFCSDWVALCIDQGGPCTNTYMEGNGRGRGRDRDRGRDREIGREADGDGAL